MEIRLEHAKGILTRTPATLNSLLRDLPEALIISNEGPDTESL